MRKNSTTIEYDELFEDVKIWEKISPDYYLKTYPAKMESACKQYKVFIRTLGSNIIDYFCKLDNRDVVFVYPLERFFNLVENIHRKYNLLTFSNIFSNMITSRYENAKVLSNSSIQKKIFESFQTHDMKYAQDALKDLSKVMKRNKVKLIILGNDWTFFERLCAISGRELNIPVVVFQHGVYHKDVINIMEFGKYSNEFWCWSDYVKDNYEKRYGIMEGFIKVVGYPHKLLDDYSFTNPQRVLFIGTPYSYENKVLCGKYEKVIEKVLSVCEFLHKEFVFRPHPNESRDYYNERFSQFDIFKLSTEHELVNDIKNSGIVIGDTSSALLEANLLHRRSIQILWNKDLGIDLEDELYNSMIKVENDEKSITNAIKDNIGKYYDGRDVFYSTGDPWTFEKNILADIEMILK